MPVIVELWVGDNLVDGAETWWDDIELALSSQESVYPLLSAVDPYGQLALQKKWLSDLAEECQGILSRVHKRAHPFLRKLEAMCDRGSKADRVELRFIGD